MAPQAVLIPYMLEKFFGRAQGKPFFQKRFPLVEEELFSKSFSPITRLGSRFRGNDTYFSFREKRKVGKRKATQRFQRSELLDGSASCAHPLHARKVFWKGSRETFFSKKVFLAGKNFFQKVSP
jgi:hypothetical protein